MDRTDKLAEYKRKHLGEVLDLYFREENWPRLQSSSFLVWTALLLEAVPVVGITSVSYRQLRGMTGIASNWTLIRAMAELKDKGYLRVLEVGGPENQARVYQLLHHRFAGADDLTREGEVSDDICGVLEEAAKTPELGISEATRHDFSDLDVNNTM